MSDTWDALDELVAEIEAANADWAEAREQRAREREAVATMLDQIDQHLRDFDPDGALDQVRERVLGGAGYIERVTTLYNLDRLYLLRWPAAADPRPELAAASGEYRVEIWLGIGERFRPRVLVVGARRMEALLPVSAEKFRSVLLSALRNPAFASHPSEEGEPQPDDGGAPQDETSPQSAGSEQPHPDQPDHEPHEQAATAAVSEGVDPASAANDEGQQPAESGAPAPADDQPIEMGPPAEQRSG